mgnify:CR=1 FL=1
MKKVVILFVFCSLFNHITWGQSSMPNIGLVSQLVQVKYEAENIVSQVSQDTSTAAQIQASKQIVLKTYNELRMQVDAVVLQLGADMQVKGSVRLFKKLNKYYSKHLLMDGDPQGKSLSKYGPAFRRIYVLNSELQQANKQWTLATNNKKPTIFDKGAAGDKGVDAFVSGALPVIELGWTIIKEWKAANQSKVEGIVTLLDGLRLTAPQDLGKKPEAKKED